MQTNLINNRPETQKYRKIDNTQGKSVRINNMLKNAKYF